LIEVGPVVGAVHREVSMAVLMLRCPMSDRNFSTGIEIDPNGFKLMSDAIRIARCPYCQQEHSWRPYDAWMMESIPPRKRPKYFDLAS